MHLLEQNPDKIVWDYLCRNPNPEAVKILEQNPDRIDWRSLSLNTSAIHLLEINQDKIDWLCLTRNESAIHLLEANQDKIDWYFISENPAIFTYDYEHMRQPFTEELMQNRFHPNNMNKFEAWGF
jgi:hypothetical protein